MKSTNFILLYLLLVLTPFVHLADEIKSDTDRPALKGKLVYHSYSNYDALDSQMYLYDFATNTLDNISKDWKSVKHMMNGHFSPDGRYIAFMGISTDKDSWDIYLYDLKRGGEPTDLTADGDYRDEDPKWSHNGEKIIFKRSGKLAEIDFNSREIEIISGNSDEELSMPYYSQDDQKVLYSGGARDTAYIGVFDKVTKKTTKVFDRENICDYYPINIDENSYYFTSRVSLDNACDQIYKGYWNGDEAHPIAANKKTADYSDAFPISDGWLFLVSTKEGGKGAYDLYIANENSGAIYSLDLYNGHINSGNNELGPAYYVEK